MRILQSVTQEFEEKMVRKRRSLLIGINGYKPAIGRLYFCASDAKTIESALNARRDGFHSTESTLLIDDQIDDLRPTKVNIVECVARICSAADIEDTILIHFSGHGQMGKDNKLYLLPIDASPISIEQTAISWQWIRDEVEKSKARNKIIILDACHSGAGRHTAQEIRTSYELARELQENSEGFVCISSCAGGQVSYELAELGQGVFSHYLVEGILGAADPLRRGVIDIESLYGYVRERTIRHAKQIKAEQEPYLISKTSVPLSTITISSSSLERPIERVLVLSNDPIIGNVLKTGIQMSDSANEAEWINDIDLVIADSNAGFKYHAVYIDIREDWTRKKNFIRMIRSQYPIVPFVLVGSREEFLLSLGEEEKEVYRHYFFYEIETPLSAVLSLIFDTLKQVEWDISTHFGELIDFDRTHEG